MYTLQIWSTVSNFKSNQDCLELLPKRNGVILDEHLRQWDPVHCIICISTYLYDFGRSLNMASLLAKCFRYTTFLINMRNVVYRVVGAHGFSISVTLRWKQCDGWKTCGFRRWVYRKPLASEDVNIEICKSCHWHLYVIAGY